MSTLFEFALILVCLALGVGTMAFFAGTLYERSRWMAAGSSADAAPVVVDGCFEYHCITILRSEFSDTDQVTWPQHLVADDAGLTGAAGGDRIATAQKRGVVC